MKKLITMVTVVLILVLCISVPVFANENNGTQNGVGLLGDFLEEVGYITPGIHTFITTDADGNEIIVEISLLPLGRTVLVDSQDRYLGSLRPGNWSVGLTFRSPLTGTFNKTQSFRLSIVNNRYNFELMGISANVAPPAGFTVGPVQHFQTNAGTLINTLSNFRLINGTQLRVYQIQMLVGPALSGNGILLSGDLMRQ